MDGVTMFSSGVLLAQSGTSAFCFEDIQAGVCANSGCLLEAKFSGTTGGM